MNIREEWWPIALTVDVAKASLRGKPLARQIDGVPIVLFRNGQGTTSALPDYCPHRLMPLSQGKICEGEIECGYHGWRFTGDGICSRVPGMDLPRQTKALLMAPGVRETNGLVWVCLTPKEEDSTLTLPAEVSVPLDIFFLETSVATTIDQAAENFLDGFHTHFVHAGWVRSDRQRQTIRASVRKIPGGIEARYEGEGRQTGIISRLFESERSWSAGRFKSPGLAEIEYHGSRGLTALISAWLVPSTTQSVSVIARVATPQGKIPAWAKAVLLKYFFQTILNQDKRALERQYHNRVRNPDIPFLDSPLDLLGPSIRMLIAGVEVPESANREVVVQI